jgi:SUMO ligase MMS21 Smc5/6 complex component
MLPDQMARQHKESICQVKISMDLTSDICHDVSLILVRTEALKRKAASAGTLKHV